MQPRKSPLNTWGLVGALSLALALILTACSSNGLPVPEGLAGMVGTPSIQVGHITLPAVSHDATPLAMAAEPGGLLLVYFGYTSCPDICPTTLGDLRTAMKELGDDIDRIDVAFVTVDPDRDTDEITSRYVQTFFPDAYALRTEDADELASAAAAFGTTYEVVEASNGTVEVGHTAFLYAISSEGTVLVQWPFGMSSELIRNDLIYLLDK